VGQLHGRPPPHRDAFAITDHSSSPPCQGKPQSGSTQPLDTFSGKRQPMGRTPQMTGQISAQTLSLSRQPGQDGSREGPQLLAYAASSR